MEAQDKQMDRSFMPEVIVTLRDLAQLSQHIGVDGAKATDTRAMKLLECLLKLCKAQRGAIFLTTQPLIGRQQSSMSFLSLKMMLRPFALLEMDENDALTLLNQFLGEDANTQSPSSEPCWVIYKLPVSFPTVHEQDAQPLQYTTEQVEQIIQPFYALLVLGWTGETLHVCPPLMERARKILPQVADGIGAVIQHELLTERLHELETTADHKALREMELLKAELLATVSHELRSPLASIKGYAATLLRHERRISREERHEFLLAINEASDRLEVVIDRLLEISQLETGTITMKRSPVNLTHLVREAIIAIEQRLADPEHQNNPAHPEAHFTFTLHMQDGHGTPTCHEPVIQADRLRLRAVLDNLLENAIDYSPDGGAIEVVIRPLFESNGEQVASSEHDERKRKTNYAWTTFTVQPMVEMCIHDNGIGIPPEHIKAIFDRFHRVDTRLIREVNGLGLGLAICKRIVELHDGMIWAESEIGKGSTFHVWLPMDVNK